MEWEGCSGFVSYFAKEVQAFPPKTNACLHVRPETALGMGIGILAGSRLWGDGTLAGGMRMTANLIWGDRTWCGIFITGW